MQIAQVIEVIQLLQVIQVQRICESSFFRLGSRSKMRGKAARNFFASMTRQWLLVATISANLSSHNCSLVEKKSSSVPFALTVTLFLHLSFFDQLENFPFATFSIITAQGKRDLQVHNPQSTILNPQSTIHITIHVLTKDISARACMWWFNLREEEIDSLLGFSILLVW